MCLPASAPQQLPVLCAGAADRPDQEDAGALPPDPVHFRRGREAAPRTAGGPQATPRPPGPREPQGPVPEKHLSFSQVRSEEQDWRVGRGRKGPPSRRCARRLRSCKPAVSGQHRASTLRAAEPFPRGRATQTAGEKTEGWLLGEPKAPRSCPSPTSKALVKNSDPPRHRAPKVLLGPPGEKQLSLTQPPPSSRRIMGRLPSDSPVSTQPPQGGTTHIGSPLWKGIMFFVCIEVLLTCNIKLVSGVHDPILVYIVK